MNKQIKGIDKYEEKVDGEKKNRWMTAEQKYGWKNLEG